MAHPVEDVYALTPLQQGMLFHTICASSPGLYVVQSCWKLRGTLDIRRFASAWQMTLRRHSALRTAFEWRDLDTPVQLVYRTVDLPIEQADWRGLSDAALRSRLNRFLEEDRSRGFDLSMPPLHRLALMRTGENQWHFAWSYHQAVLDGWSCALIQSEVRAAYDVNAGEEAATLEEPAPYRDYIAWLQQQDPECSRQFWCNQLEGFNPATRILPRQSGESGSVLATGQSEAVLVFEKSSTDGLNRALRRARVTLNTLVHAAWAQVLSARSGSGDVVFGTVVSGRPPSLRGVESMVGFFINTIPTRVVVPTHQPVGRWLQELQANMLAARDHEHCALVDIQGWCGLKRGHALFDMVLAFENYPVDDPGGGWGGDTEVIDFIARENLNYPIALYAGVVGGQLMLKALYDADYFRPNTVQLVLEELEATLVRITGDLTRPVASIDILPTSERHQLTTTWNSTQADFPLDRSFSELFEQQVMRTPERRAVACGKMALTYAELNRQANSGAGALTRAGIGPGRVVAILADRDIDFLIAILAIFKAGGAYLPLDQRAPTARLAKMLEPDVLSLVLYSPAYASACREAAAAVPGASTLLRPLSECTGSTGSNESETLKPNSPSDLAYIIFTSGSTGIPKGAMVEQRGMLNHLFAKVADLGLSETDRIAQNASQCFDISVWQFLAALLVGGETHIFPDEIAHDPSALLKAAEKEGVTILEMVPSVLKLAFDVGHAGDLPELATLRWMVPTGEALPPWLVDSWLGRYPHVPMLNAYGPTECSDDVTHHVVLSQPPDETTSIPIGNPIANATVYILDDRMRLVPVGVPGELYVGGICVGRGYVNDPLKTAECFLPDHFATDAGARLYRTGDLARYLPDGTIDYLGRIDHQVKIRGFRIELGEIEATMVQLEEIDQCVVVARPTENGDDKLIAYFTPAGTPYTNQELRGQLRTSLPDYMIPQAFIPLDALPLTPNGKLDRTALPSPDVVPHVFATDAHPPETAVEKHIATTWQEVLGIDHVSRHDNFFDLGGHSLLMLRVFEKLRQSYAGLALVDLFHYPSVEALAEFVCAEDPGKSGQPDEGHGATRRQALQRLRERRIRTRTGS